MRSIAAAWAARCSGTTPAKADPCGEKGEFHSLVFDGPIFSKPVQFQRAEAVLREERFSFCDLLPQAPKASTSAMEWKGERSRR